MIVRVLNGGGQFEVSEGVVARLNELDERATAALDESDETEVGALLAQMTQIVQSEGTRVPDDDLSASGLVIPPPDLSLGELRALFSEQGLIPDLPV
jgi:PspAA-like protein